MRSPSPLLPGVCSFVVLTALLASAPVASRSTQPARSVPLHMLSVLSAVAELPEEEGAGRETSSDAAQAEFAGMATNRRRRKRGRRRGELVLSDDEHHIWLRTGGCARAASGERRFFCPTPDRRGDWQCVAASQLCDGVHHCPGREDEHATACLFYSAVMNHLDTLSDSVLSMTEHNRIHAKRKDRAHHQH